MFTMIGLFFRGLALSLWPYLLGLGAVGLLLLGLYEKGRIAGGQAVTAKTQRQVIRSQARVKNEIVQADHVRDAVRDLPAAKLRQHDKFWRP